MEEPKLSFVGYTDDGKVTDGWLPLENIASDLEAFQAGVDRANELVTHLRENGNTPLFMRVMKDAQKSADTLLYAGFMHRVADVITGEQ